MAVPPAYHESLPYIDPAPSEESLDAARALIAAEAASAPSSSSSTTEQPPPFPSLHLTPALQASLAQHPGAAPTSAIDLSRYEAQEPSSSSSASDHLAALANAYVSASYLAARATNLDLLDRHGRNAWLVGNHQLEAELRRLEAELAAARRDIDVVNLERRRRQEEVSGEMAVLEDGWRKGIGRVLETEVAVEELKARIRDELRAREQGAAQ